MEGNKPRVKVEHFRAGLFRAGLFGGVDRYQRGRGFFIDGEVIKKTPQERGGWTKAIVVLNIPPDFRPRVKYVHVYECTVFAAAICSEQDAFNYKRGRAIAVGRLRKQLELWGLEDTVTWP